MRRHSLEENIHKVEPFVELLKENIRHFLVKHQIRTVPYDTGENIKLQRNGIDLLVTSERGDWEAKIRSHRYYLDKILLETVSVKEKNIPGWVHTCQADAIAYCWFNPSETNLMRTGYIILVKELRETSLYKELTTRYPEHTTGSESDTGERGWTSCFVLVPQVDFPKGTLYPFNPALELREYNQAALSNGKKETRP